jgi:hypothetical protein
VTEEKGVLILLGSVLATSMATLEEDRNGRESIGNRTEAVKEERKR